MSFTGNFKLMFLNASGRLFGGETHPYDIHQILLAHHGIYPGYELEA